MSEFEIKTIEDQRRLNDVLTSHKVIMLPSRHKGAFVKIVNLGPDLVIIDRTENYDCDEYLTVKLKLHYSAANISLPKIIILGKDESVVNKVEKLFCDFMPMTDANYKLINKFAMDDA
ncbi:MAG: hypothetical protein COW00_06740 [Bdellovibrio sp. CG12_big_fil_rev_8_21_14_0_65_39_13]|nr:MAG: hypothetical protein COW78_04235 [Bdellovibrio sp. CG22_combo_CG10-13_8_21_14_all_39_27]PIQ60449.1 MAG: hypothetical protein COW00_06740 [Bdellovibrio sp. CG12_big_fil_rev_8_21_14_0_65_39_13]PIR34972.1 MAG: hypothetical protein COV37_11040 [Bdellovibrio sp. CG11_big_fil_rev_8_21_14_0_20_39_38]